MGDQMDMLELVEQWIACYAVKKKYARVLNRLCVREEKAMTELVPPCTLEACVLYEIIQSRDVQHYDTSMSIVLGLSHAVSQKIRPSVLAKILDAMKVVVLFDLMKKQTDMTCMMLNVNQYFPSATSTPPSPQLPPLIEERLAKYRAGYRSFFLSLLANPEYRAEYLKKRYRDEFGKNFEARLTELVMRVVNAVDREMPMSPIEKLLQGDAAEEFRKDLRTYNQAAIELLLDTCTGRPVLLENDCLQLLNILRPINSLKYSSEPQLTLQSSYFSSQTQTQIEQKSPPGVEALLLETPSVSDQQNIHNNGNQGSVSSGLIKRKRNSIDLEDFEEPENLQQRHRPQVQKKESNFKSLSDKFADKVDCLDDSQAFTYPRGQVYRMKSKRARTSFNTSVHGIDETLNNSEQIVESNATTCDDLSVKQLDGKSAEKISDKIIYEIVTHSEDKHAEMNKNPVSPSDSSVCSDHQMAHMQQDEPAEADPMSDQLSPYTSTPLVILQGAEVVEVDKEASERSKDSDHVTDTPEQVDLVSSSSQGSEAPSIISLPNSGSSAYHTVSQDSPHKPGPSSPRATLSHSNVDSTHKFSPQLYRAISALKDDAGTLSQGSDSGLEDKENAVNKSHDSSVIEVVSSASQKGVISQELDTSFESYVASSIGSDRIVPSSNVCDKFDALLIRPIDVVKKTLPALHTHLRSPHIKNCIIKLHHNPKLETETWKNSLKLYS